MSSSEVQSLLTEIAAETRSYLRWKLQLKLANLYISDKKYRDALELLSALSLEVRKMDDKSFQIDVLLLEAQVHTTLKNYAKAKASLTGARAASNAIYCPPKQAASLDLQSGVLHLQEGDANTAFSYLLESFTTLDNMNDPKAFSVLMYMIIAKLVHNRPQDVPSVLTDKLLVKYGEDARQQRLIYGLVDLAKAFEARSLSSFSAILESHFQEISDVLIVSQFELLSDRLLEFNLLRLVEPYSVIELSVVSSRIGLPLSVVESRLASIIMDGKLNGLIDQQKAILVVESGKGDSLTELSGLAHGCLAEYSTVVDKLMERSKKVVVQ
ncbi:hypothetical protein RCL1_003330 [Eukaryota sp. TZLM3-RCL]